MEIIQIRTLTPIWTGNINRKCPKLKETGIIGSLRWWYEALVRGFGGYACDPTSEGRCPTKYNEGKKYYCLACLVWGATGLKRSFKLEICNGEQVYDGNPINIKPSGRNRGWYLGSGIVNNGNDIEIKITPLADRFNIVLFSTPFVIASKFGAIGAKVQHGYGVVEIKNHMSSETTNFVEVIEKMKKEKILFNVKIREGTTEGYPNLKEMFFAKIQFEVVDDDWWKEVDGVKVRENDPRVINWINSGSVPIVPAIKNWLRYGDGSKLWKTNNLDMRIENWLFGTTKNNKIASKINISFAYKINSNLWEFRIWGWVPSLNLQKFDKEKFLDKLKEYLREDQVPFEKLLGSKTRNFTLKVWREFNSDRDTIRKEDNFSDYIKSLIGV